MAATTVGSRMLNRLWAPGAIIMTAPSGLQLMTSAITAAVVNSDQSYLLAAVTDDPG